MKINAKLKEFLLRSFDEDLSEKEKKELAQALENSAELQAEKAQWQRIRLLISDLRVESSPDFTNQLMGRLRKGEKENMSPMVISIFPKVAAACLLVFFISLLSIYLSTGSLSVDSIIGVQDLTPEDASIYLGSI